MKIVDMARALAPDREQKIVGIRPGEKLHEVMITEDDARMTIELDDRYVIVPPDRGWSADHLAAWGGRPVSSDFRYASNSNNEWLDACSMMKLLQTKST